MDIRYRWTLIAFIAAQILVPLTMLVLRWLGLETTGAIPSSWQMYSTLP